MFQTDLSLYYGKRLDNIQLKIPIALTVHQGQMCMCLQSFKNKTSMIFMEGFLGLHSQNEQSNVSNCKHTY